MNIYRMQLLIGTLLILALMGGCGGHIIVQKRPVPTVPATIPGLITTLSGPDFRDTT